jgi:hypothetical protein
VSFIATTRAKIATGESEDDYGNPVVAPLDPAAKAHPMSIIEKTKTIMDPTTGERRTVRYAIGRIKAGVPISDGDRIHDMRTGRVYVVDEMTDNPRTIAGFSDVRLDLRIIDGE